MKFSVLHIYLKDPEELSLTPGWYQDILSRSVMLLSVNIVYMINFKYSESVFICFESKKLNIL
jgi:hypothetical protein